MERGSSCRIGKCGGSIHTLGDEDGAAVEQKKMEERWRQGAETAGSPPIIIIMAVVIIVLELFIVSEHKQNPF
jgi:hypothetical protein